MPGAKDLDGSNFNEFIEKNDVALVDFFADWCGPCQMMKPVIDELAEEMEGKAGIAKLNIDSAKEIAIKFGVMSIPTIVIFKDGKEADRMVGAMPKETIVEKLQRFIG